MNYPDVYIAKIGSSPYAASANSYQNKSAIPQNESTATKPTGWADSASISIVQADLRDSRGKVRSSFSGRPVRATVRSMVLEWLGKRSLSCAAGRSQSLINVGVLYMLKALSPALPASRCGPRLDGDDDSRQTPQPPATLSADRGGAALASAPRWEQSKLIATRAFCATSRGRFDPDWPPQTRPHLLALPGMASFPAGGRRKN